MRGIAGCLAFFASILMYLEMSSLLGQIQLNIVSHTSTFGENVLSKHDSS